MHYRLMVFYPNNPMSNINVHMTIGEICALYPVLCELRHVLEDHQFVRLEVAFRDCWILITQGD